MVVKLYGDNVVTVEGPDWRRHRKIVAPAFSEKSNALAWEQSLNQARGMLKFWARIEGNNLEELKIQDTSVDTATLTLHVLSGTGFGIPQIWPGEEEKVLGDKKAPGLNTTELIGKHSMTFKESLRRSCTVNILWLALFPQWLLSMSMKFRDSQYRLIIIGLSPLKIHKEILLAYDECGQYLKQLFEFKKHQKEAGLQRGRKQGITDLISKLLKYEVIGKFIYKLTSCVRPPYRSFQGRKTGQI
jgi:hypothetical protein